MAEVVGGSDQHMDWEIDIAGVFGVVRGDRMASLRRRGQFQGRRLVTHALRGTCGDSVQVRAWLKLWESLVGARQGARSVRGESTGWRRD